MNRRLPAKAENEGASPALISNLIVVNGHAPHKETVLVLRIDDPEFFDCRFQR